MIKKILIANRGEIAVRIIKTCNRLNIKTVAIYSQADKNSLFVELADERYLLNGSSIQETYLNIDNIITIAKKSQVDAIHPGYGFLSENSDFAKKVLNNNIIFIGPGHEAIAQMGLKSTAKDIMIKAGVNVLPGYNQPDQSEDVLIKAAQEIGYPILIKAAAGGGGKGMRIVHNPEDLIPQINACKREALKSFNNDQVILEKYLTNPRHIEVQILFDNYNHGVYLFERDCSVQRRYQKVIEEAPAPGITETLRKTLGTEALKAGHAVNYVGAGTIEFLVDKDQVYFMEMNTRLQVEHPVTEMITGLDLVEQQINIANNKKLDLTQEALTINGHAIEVRLYSEDVENNFLPATGRIEYLEFPNNYFNNNFKNIRIDTGIKVFDNVTIFFDPMLAKIIAWGQNRQEAIYQLVSALQKTYLAGVKTNIKFLIACLKHEEFQAGNVSTGFINKNINNLIKQDPEQDPGLYLVIASIYLNFCSNKNFSIYNQDPWQDLFNYRNCLPNKSIYFIDSEIIELNLNNSLVNKKYYINKYININIDYLSILYSKSKKQYVCVNTCIEQYENFANISFVIFDKKITVKVVKSSNKIYIFNSTDGTIYSYYFKDKTSHADQLDPGALTAPMPGTIIAVKVTNGSEVKAGDALVILEAMKMEHTIYSPINGIVKNILFKQGEQVALGTELLIME